MKRQINHISVSSDQIARPLTFALVADLHNAPYADVLPALRQADAILILGDLVNRHRRGYEHALRFLQEAPDCAPTFYALGNHEWKFPQREEYWPHVERSRVQVLDNAFTVFRGIVLGGLSSAPKGMENASFLKEMAAQEGFKLLICHHPEMFAPFVRDIDRIDLTVAGHAHGGQVRVFDRGLYSPGQGLLPLLTSGFYFDGRLFISRGMTNSSRAPRWNNPCELVMLHLTNGEG